MSGHDDWQQADRLLEQALEEPTENRRSWLDHACGEDAALRSRLERLLRLAEEEDDMLTPGGGLTGPVGEEVVQALESGGQEELLPGSRLGPYEILELLGVGGMGRVYRAHDPKLGRDVAIKALSGPFATDESSFRRLEREARVLATLSHPNIASIFDLLVLEDKPYLVLEYVEGETLDRLIASEQLHGDRVVEAALQITAALEAAHAKGIVHRDLKPSNVKIEREGRVKVLDFGLARRMEAKQSRQDLSATVTAEGLVLGTVPYMSPEQARGEEIDARTDIWAFGCLLYEMLTGLRAFTGRTVSDILAALLRDPVDFDRLPPDTHPILRRVLRRCLQRDPRRRYQHAGDIRIELLELEESLEEGGYHGAARSQGSRLAATLPWAVAGLALVGLAWIGLARDRSAASAPAPEVQQFVLALPPGVGLPSGDYASPMALSPDGRAMVLLGEDADEHGHLYHRTLERLEWVRLQGTVGAWQPFFSANGREVGFFASGRLQRVALDGTAPVTVARVGPNPRGATWTKDDTIIYGASHTSPLFRVDAHGGSPEPLTRLDESRGERSHRWPQVLPGGEWVVFTIDFLEKTFDDAALALISLETGERRQLEVLGSHARYVPSGHLVFARQGRLFAVPFDLERLRATGAPTSVLEGVAYDLRNGGAKIAVAGDGTLAYVPDPLQSEDRRLVWLDLEGRREVLTEEARRFHDPAVSLDGRRVAVRIGDPTASDLWTLDLESGTLAQVTFGLRAFRPVWSPDGSRLALGVEEDEGWALIVIDADGQAEPRVVRRSASRLYPGVFSSDGRSLVFQERRIESGWDLSIVDLDEDGLAVGEARSIVATQANETNPALSADDGFLAYESDEVDQPISVFVQPFGRPGGRIDVASGGGRWPRWGSTGRLYYWSAFRNEMREVDYRLEKGRLLVAGERIVWSLGRGPIVVPVSEFLGRGFDFDAKDDRFLMLEAADAPAEELAPKIILALHWAEGLARPDRGNTISD